MLSKLFCKHNWTILDRSVVSCEYGWQKTCYVLICRRCGKVKKLTVR